MDPKFLINTGQTNTKTAPKNAVDVPGDSVLQSGKGFKEAFKAASGAEATAPVGIQGDAAVDARKPSSGAGEVIKHTGKHLPQKSETGKYHPVNSLQKALPGHTFSGDDIEIEEGVTRSDIRNHSSAGSNGSDDDRQVVLSKGEHAHTASRHTSRHTWSSDSETSIRGESREALKTSTTLSVEPLSLGQIKVVLPNGAATRDELVEFAKVQKLPAEFVAQLQGFEGDKAPFISRDDGLRASARSIDLSSVIRGPSVNEALVSVADTDQGSIRSPRPITTSVADTTSVAESAIRSGAGDKSELTLSMQKALTSTEFVSYLMQKLEINPEYKATHATQSEPTYSDVVELIVEKLSKTTRPVVTQEAPLIIAKTEEARVIHDSIVETLASDALTNLSDNDLNSISNQLASLFTSVTGDQKSKLSDPEIDLRPQTSEVGSIKLPLSSNRWSLHSDGTLGRTSLNLHGDQRPGNPVAVGSTVQTLAAEKFDTSLIMARPVDGGAPRALSADELPEPVKVGASRTEKSLTSSELLDLRNVGTVRSEVMSVRVSSSNDLGGHISSSPEVVSVISSSLTDKPVQSVFDQVAPVTTETGVQTQNSSTRSSANDAMRAMQHQPGHQLEGDKLNLSARLTQALGERLVQHIRNGNYNIRFNIHPKELGVVDVAMEVRDGRLETQISSPSAVTRDLLSDSLPRLRDSLQAGGLQLAGLEVSDNSNDGQQRSLKGSSGNSLDSDINDELVETFEVDNLIIDDEAIDYLA